MFQPVDMKQYKNAAFKGKRSSTRHSQRAPIIVQTTEFVKIVILFFTYLHCEIVRIFVS